jgi:hypothetical protein
LALKGRRLAERGHDSAELSGEGFERLHSSPSLRYVDNTTKGAVVEYLYLQGRESESMGESVRAYLNGQKECAGHRVRIRECKASKRLVLDTLV